MPLSKVCAQLSPLETTARFAGLGSAAQFPGHRHHGRSRATAARSLAGLSHLREQFSGPPRRGEPRLPLGNLFGSGEPALRLAYRVADVLDFDVDSERVGGERIELSALSRGATESINVLFVGPGYRSPAQSKSAVFGSAGERD